MEAGSVSRRKLVKKYGLAHLKSEEDEKGEIIDIIIPKVAPSRSCLIFLLY